MLLTKNLLNAHPIVSQFFDHVLVGLSEDQALPPRVIGITELSDYPADPLNTGVAIPHYDTLDIRAGLDWGRYRLQARVANLLNEHGLDTVVDQRILGNPPAEGAIIPPRTFVLSCAVNF